MYMWTRLHLININQLLLFCHICFIFFSFYVMVCIYVHTLLSLLLLFNHWYHCRLMPFTPKYKCISPKNKIILLCGNSTVIKFRTLNMDIIVLSNIRPYLNITNCPEDVFCRNHTHLPNPWSFFYYLSLVLQTFMILPFLNSVGQL